MAPAAQKRTPIYEQIKQDLIGRIAAGEWAEGEQLPSEHELVASLGVSRMTVHRALRELTARGVLSRRQGLGTFVAPQTAQADLIAIRDIAEDVRARGHAHRAEVRTLEAIGADAALAEIFAIKPGARLYHSLIVHFEDETPIQMEERFINARFAPDYLKQDFTAITPARYLQRIGRATEIEQIVHAIAPDARARKLLKIDADQPCLLVTRRTWAGATPATKSRFTYPGDRYALGSRYKVSDFGG